MKYLCLKFLNVTSSQYLDHFISFRRYDRLTPYKKTQYKSEEIYFRLFIVLVHISTKPSFASDSGKLLIAAAALSAYS